MELGEAAALADTFITSLIFKVHSLPLSERSARAAQWWRKEGSRIPLRAALEEKRRHLSCFSSRKKTDKPRDRCLHLTISAMTNDHGQGRCPALQDAVCGIYERRPLTCRTVPLHYSRPMSVLGRYIDTFTGSAGYECDTSANAPAILEGRSILDPLIRQARDDAISMAKTDKAWKDRMLLMMDDPAMAAAAGLPTYNAVLENSHNGYATTLPMIVAWRIARNEGLMPPEVFEDVCRKQAALIKAHMETLSETAGADLRDMLPAYEFELSAPPRPTRSRASILMPQAP